MVCKTFINSNLFSCKKLEIEVIKLQHSSNTIALSKGTILAKKHCSFEKNADISKIKRALVLKGIFSETTYVCVLMCQI